jgi:hypothetical protein
MGSGTETTAVAPSGSPSQPLSHDEGKIDGQQWEVVPSPETDDDTPRSSASSHFHLKVGWGQWKWTLLSWDLNINAEYEKP